MAARPVLAAALLVDLTQPFLFNEKMGKCEHTNVFSAILPSIVRQYLGQVSCVTGNEQTLCVVVMETSLQGKKKRAIGQLSYQQHCGDKVSMRVKPLDAALPTVFFVSMSLLTSKYLLHQLCIFRYK